MNKLLTLLSLVVLVSGCASKEFKKGSYNDPTKINLLTDDFSESDAQVLSEATIKQYTNAPHGIPDCGAFSPVVSKPVVMIGHIENRTEEHIDIKMMTSSVRNALIRSGKVRFINNDARTQLSDEYSYNESGAVADGSKKVRGKQIGADYMIVGSLFTVVQEVGKQKTVYYKFNTELTSVETSEVVCSTEQQIRKEYQKKR